MKYVIELEVSPSDDVEDDVDELAAFDSAFREFITDDYLEADPTKSYETTDGAFSFYVDSVTITEKASE